MRKKRTGGSVKKISQWEMKRERHRGRRITLMRRKSWLRQASRDRRPRRTQSSISPSYERNTQCDDGRERKGGRTEEEASQDNEVNAQVEKRRT